MQKRYSKKRESILECLQITKEHPSAEWIYNQLKPIYPDLSLGTVYRNINQLKLDGKICTVAVINGKERYDGDMTPHTHAICAVCGKIIDVEGLEIPPELTKNAQELAGFSISFSKLQFIGVCKECMENGDGMNE